MRKKIIYQLQFWFYRFFLDYKLWLLYITLITMEARMDMLLREILTIIFLSFLCGYDLLNFTHFLYEFDL